MTLSNLYFRGCFEPPSDDQKVALEAIPEGGVEGDVVDKSCSRESINTCGISIEELFNTYSIYNPQKGLYKSWGDIEFPWEISASTPNLLLASTDDRWSVATYRAFIAYAEDSYVLYIEEDGYKVSLYQANQDVVAISGAFDYSKWDKICHVETAIPVGLPTIEELLSRYSFYELKFFDKEWSRYSESWEANLKEQTMGACMGQGLSIKEFEKCVRGGSSDEWDEARVRRDFFYRAGDIVLSEGTCGDSLCVYIALQDIPATEEVFEQYQKLSPSNPFWSKAYCVATGRNKCLEYQRTKDPAAGYDVVEIGTKGHFVEVPAPYRLKPTTPSLEERSQIRTPPRVLSQEEIDALTQPQEQS